MKSLKNTLAISMTFCVHMGFAQFPVLNTATITARPLTTLGSGQKFTSSFVGSAGTLTIYNTDLSVHRVLQWPPAPAGMNWSAIFWITEDLFDTDPSTIEFVLQAHNISEPPFGAAVGIYREDGTEIFFQDGTTLNNGHTGTYLGYSIFNDNGVTKMLLTSGPDLETATVYQLPGQLPCMNCTGSPQGSGLMNGTGPEVLGGDGIRLFPNPTNSELNVMIPDGSPAANIHLMDAAGRLVGVYPVSSGKNLVPIHHLSNGTYSCQLISGGRSAYAGQFIVSR